MPKKKPVKKPFKPTSKFSPLEHEKPKAEKKVRAKPEPSPEQLITKLLEALQGAQPKAPPQKREYTNSQGFPRVEQRGGDKGEPQWFDTVNNEWRSFDALMSRIGQLEAAVDFLKGECKRLNRYQGE